MFEVLTQLETFATELGSSPWLLLLVGTLVLVDGVFPPVPGEAVLITAAVLAASGSGPPLLLVIAVGALAAFLGDLLAFSLGRRLPLHRMPGLRGDRPAAVLARAGQVLHRRGATVVVMARFLPIARVAVNVSAGALGMPGRRFAVAAGAGAVLWSAYNVLVGIGAYAVLGGSTLLSIAVGILAGLATGLIVEAVLRRFESTQQTTTPVDGEFAPCPPMA